MAAPPAKRFQPYASSAYKDVSNLVVEAQSIEFPWATAIPPKICDWFQVYAKSHNTAPEYVFIGALVTTAAIMGPRCFVQVRETYQEPTNLYAISVGFPGSGKSQAYRMTVTEPLAALDSPMETMLVDDYTKRGLFRHLQGHDGRALLAHEEMGAFFDLVQKRQLEGNAERQLYCRLYDGGQWVTSTGLKKSEGRQETSHNCICIHGYVQPQPFIERIYPQLTETDDGFVDRLLVCFPKNIVLLEKEIDRWCEQLHASPLTSLVKPLSMIAEWHKDGEHVYRFDDEGMEVYRLFADDMARIMNKQWQSGTMNQGNVSKDKRTMIRLSGIIHVFYKAMNLCLPSSNVGGEVSDLDVLPLSPSPPPNVEAEVVTPSSPNLDMLPLSPLPPPINMEAEVVTPSDNINEEEATMSMMLTEYFQAQRSVYDKVRFKSAKESSQQRSLTSWILLSKGAYCTPRSVTRSVTCKIKPSAEKVVEVMKRLQEERLGVFKGDNEKEKVFFKKLPTENNKELIAKHVSFKDFETNFKMDIEHMTATQIKRLLKLSPDKDCLVEEYGYEV